VALLLPLALMIGLIGRGHVFQAMGWLPCAEAPSSAEIEHAHDDGESDDTHDDCPANCHRCPCGQIPMVQPAIPVPSLCSAFNITELALWMPPAVRGDAHPQRLDRPPRPLDLS
jgi:hypothetical protein